LNGIQEVESSILFGSTFRNDRRAAAVHSAAQRGAFGPGGRARLTQHRLRHRHAVARGIQRASRDVVIASRGFLLPPPCPPCIFDF
jgi:hypothetical protein